MGELIISLLPLIIGSAVVPVQVIIDILLLKSPKQGLLKASAYVGGMTTLRLLQGLIFGLVLTNSTAASTDEASGKSSSSINIAPDPGYLLIDHSLQALAEGGRSGCSTSQMVGHD